MEIVEFCIIDDFNKEAIKIAEVTGLSEEEIEKIKE